MENRVRIINIVWRCGEVFSVSLASRHTHTYVYVTGVGTFQIPHCSAMQQAARLLYPYKWHRCCHSQSLSFWAWTCCCSNAYDADSCPFVCVACVRTQRPLPTMCDSPRQRLPSDEGWMMRHLVRRQFDYLQMAVRMNRKKNKKIKPHQLSRQSVRLVGAADIPHTDTNSTSSQCGSRITKKKINKIVYVRNVHTEPAACCFSYHVRANTASLPWPA